MIKREFCINNKLKFVYKNNNELARRSRPSKIQNPSSLINSGC